MYYRMGEEPVFLINYPEARAENSMLFGEQVDNFLEMLSIHKIKLSIPDLKEMFYKLWG